MAEQETICIYVKDMTTVVWEKFGVKKFSSDARYDKN